MKDHNERYKTWSDASIKAWCNKDVNAQLLLFVEHSSYQAADPFDQNEILRGKSALRDYLQSFSSIKDACMLKNEILSSSADVGIGNARVSWKSESDQTWACDFIYVITLNLDDQCTSYKEWNVVRPMEED